MKDKDFWIIMPVYNESESINSVIEEWMNEIAKHELNKLTFCLIDDGSKDDSLVKMNAKKEVYRNLKIISKQNSGHGQTCILGYKTALHNGAEWVMQLDSDGQCDPQYLKQFLEATKNSLCIYGNRVSRDDGFKRMIISRFVSIFTLASTRTWIKDANVPYRLMHKDILINIVEKIPQDFHLANILVSVLCKHQTNIQWIPIHFRNRTGGIASVKTFSFVKHGFKLFKQLRSAI
jgi:dolichol-phosphate mannosyltransferase